MATKPPPSWLKNAIFYELYPQSFLDTNGDGIGDLCGIIKKLDYIQSLGCTAIWLNPCFESPFGDAGYDVSDFRKVAPRYGTNADLIRLFKEAHRRGMKVCLDLVAAHSSFEHPWFKASASADQSPTDDWYIWSNSGWTECTEKYPFVRGHGDRNGAYLPNFFYFQPALNYGFQEPDPDQPWQLPTDHPAVREVREEMKEILRFWMDRGADGFRVDMANSLVKNDPKLKGTIAFWKEVRAMFDADYPDHALISEWSFPKDAIEAGFHMDFMIHFQTEAYTILFREEAARDSFGNGGGKLGHSYFDAEGKGDVTRFLCHFESHLAAVRGRGYISVPTGNHDLTRLNCGRSVRDLKVAFAFLWTLPGVPYLYMGDEIGMRYLPGLPSKEGGFGRTGSRTPMQWTKGKNAGFSKAPAAKLYLPLDPAKNRPTVSDQEKNKNSLLQHVRAMADLRHRHPALQADGDFEVLHASSTSSVLIYLRSEGNEEILVVVNPAAQAETLKIPNRWKQAHALKRMGCNLHCTEDLAFELKGQSFGVFVMEN